ncbi:mitochondrial metalloendopeptidase OMA1-like [Triticum aestivum]|uniref:mitochondrial metalloendopeptidase OMA1-like n=1 Tax=Triticum aestivum TaxID=4565 RepID=UPI001D02DCFB|nr:mitochondrial metalloendopeptidase OMA1-like [Triticum aestivum]
MMLGNSRRRILSFEARGRRPRTAASRSDYLLRHSTKPAAVCRSPPLCRRYCTSQPVGPRPRWYHNPLKVASAAVLASGVTGLTALAYYRPYLDIEVVSYTNRIHVVVLSSQSERELCVRRFDEDMNKYAAESRIVDPLHPDTVRVRRILEKLIRAARKDAQDLDDGTRRKQQGKKPSRLQPHAGHLHGVKWELILVKDDRVNAGCLPGKIMVTTGLLEVLKTDAEIAVVLGHEVGHVIARHKADIARQYWFPTLLWRPFFSMMEIEADHIGIMLLGGAGFDPNTALVVLWKLAKIDALTKEESLVSPYPSYLKRSQYLSQHKVMQKAMELYKEATPDQGDDKQAGDGKGLSFRESLRNQCNIVSTRLKRGFGGISTN